MDPHKPKPWHGLREFLKEYVIIVVGVLTALGAEQGVEWVHWRHVAEQADRKLSAGVSFNVNNALLRVALEPCVTARTLQLSKALQSNDPMWRGTAVPLMPGLTASALPPVVREPKGNFAHGAWEIAVAQGALAHLPDDRASDFAAVYIFSERIREDQNAESDLEARLGPLAFDRPLNSQQRDAYMAVLTQLDTKQTRVVALSKRVITAARQLGVKPPPGLRATLAQIRAQRGACVQDVDYPGV
jgi:hypothetical protein